MISLSKGLLRYQGRKCELSTSRIFHVGVSTTQDKGHSHSADAFPSSERHAPKKTRISIAKEEHFSAGTETNGSSQRQQATRILTGHFRDITTSSKMQLHACFYEDWKAPIIGRRKLFSGIGKRIKKEQPARLWSWEKSPTAWRVRGLEWSMNSRRAFTFFRSDWDIELHRSILMNFSDGLVSTTFAEVISRKGGVSLRRWDKHGGAASLPHKSSQVCTALCITFYIHVHVDLRSCACTQHEQAVDLSTLYIYMTWLVYMCTQHEQAVDLSTLYIYMTWLVYMCTQHEQAVDLSTLYIYTTWLVYMCT